MCGRAEHPQSETSGCGFCVCVCVTEWWMVLCFSILLLSLVHLRRDRASRRRLFRFQPVKHYNASPTILRHTTVSFSTLSLLSFRFFLFSPPTVAAQDEHNHRWRRIIILSGRLVQRGKKRVMSLSVQVVPVDGVWIMIAGFTSGAPNPSAGS